jgi:hypothetical protein
VVARCAALACRSVLALTLAVQERTARNPELRASPGSQTFVREALQTAAGTSILEIEGCCVLRLLCNYDRSDAETLTFN